MRPCTIGEFVLRPRSVPVVIPTKEAPRYAKNDDVLEKPAFPEMAVWADVDAPPDEPEGPAQETPAAEVVQAPQRLPDALKRLPLTLGS